LKKELAGDTSIKLTKRSFVNFDKGQIHYRYAGSKGEVVILLHQTPRSSNEFLDVIPRLATRFRVFAPDTIGMGDSFSPKTTPTIQTYSDWTFKFMDALNLSKANLVGHHTGAVIALEMAASHPERVKRLVLSNCPYVDREKRKMMKARPPIDEFQTKEDGSHLIDLWNRRKAIYPRGRPELLNRFIIDVLKADKLSEVGHRAVALYNMERRIGLVECPVLVLCGSDDQYAFPDRTKLSSKLRYSKSKIIPGGMVPMPDQMPKEFSDAVGKFISANG
jgi:pimeloyl-ACP methyl ester carboxylesterase